MKLWRVLVVGLTCALLTACGSSKPQDLIVGKWKLITDDPSVDYTQEYTSDGKYKSKAATRRYKFLDDKTIAYYDEGGGGESKYTVAVTSSELTLTSGDNRVEKFKRIR
jgi:hypothetical protein